MFSSPRSGTDLATSRPSPPQPSWPALAATAGRVGKSLTGKVGRVAAVVGLLGGVGLVGVVTTAAPAAAAAETETFAYTGAEQTFTVPAGVTSIKVKATGARGARGLSGRPAGLGAVVTADLSVTPGRTLYIQVGGTPTDGNTCSSLPCIGGFNGGGFNRFGHGGGGGGATDIRTTTRDESSTLSSRLVVAAGGGGSSGNSGSCLPTTGGVGGDAGADGGSGSGCPQAAGGSGGRAGTLTGGGAGGAPDGTAGSLGLGGRSGGNQDGGGGGGGLYGGGGGGDIRYYLDPVTGGTRSGAGGGGGGSSLVPVGGEGPTVTSEPASVTISYVLGDTNRPPVADAGPDQTGTVPASVQFDGTASSDPDGDAVSYAWDFTSDGTVDATSPTASHTYNAVGHYTASLTVTDAQGASSTDTALVTVTYPFTGFFAPVDNLPTVNSLSAGRAVSVKFSLGGDRGLDILAIGSPTSGAYPCSSGTPVDAIEETVTAGGSSLGYDAPSQIYTYVWKTQKAWADTCRQLVVTLTDGTSHRAAFQFVK